MESGLIALTYKLPRSGPLELPTRTGRTATYPSLLIAHRRVAANQELHL